MGTGSTVIPVLKGNSAGSEVNTVTAHIKSGPERGNPSLLNFITRAFPPCDDTKHKQQFLLMV